MTMTPFPIPPSVLILALDGFPPDAITAELTPSLAALARQGASAPTGGIAPLPSSTHPGFADLLTGASAERHGIRANGPADPAIPGWAGSATVRVPTLLARCRAAGIPTTAVAGDLSLYPLLGLADADGTWPEGPRLPDGIALDPLGGVPNEAVGTRAIVALTKRRHGPVVAFVHLNEADTVGHLHGPSSPAAQDTYHETDRLVGRLLRSIFPDWWRWIVIVVSDHGMEEVRDPRGVDPLKLPGIPAIADAWVSEHGSAWLHLRPGVDDTAISAALGPRPEVTGWERRGPVLRIDGRPGIAWEDGTIRYQGMHGGPTTSRTVAIVGGGHPLVPRLAAAVTAEPPALRDWAPTIAGTFGILLPEAEGRDLLAGPVARTDEAA